MNVPVQKISVSFSSGSYPVLVGGGLLHESGVLLLQALQKPPSRVLVVSSPRILKLHGRSVEQSLRKAKISFSVITAPDGERAKTLRTVETILSGFASARADRHSCVLALGGGVIGDMAGFAAATYMRGISLVQAPTTLLAQVDASIGGKTGVNLEAGKNLVGSFFQPRLVLCDPDVLRTLPQREYVAGLFEVLKSGFIRDPALINLLSTRRSDVLRRNEELIEQFTAAAVRVKAEVVALDEKEEDLRRILNFGHTIGHAMESATAYKTYLHGEAVGLGMLAAAYLAEVIGVSQSYTTSQIESLILSYADLPKATVSSREIWKRIAGDKKTLHGVVHFVLVPQIGSTRIVADIPENLIRASYDRMKKMVNAR